MATPSITRLSEVKLLGNTAVLGTQRSKTMLLKKRNSILAKHYHSKNLKMYHKIYSLFFLAIPYLNTFALKMGTLAGTGRYIRGGKKKMNID